MSIAHIEDLERLQPELSNSDLLEESKASGTENILDENCETPKQKVFELPQQPVKPPSYSIFVNELGQTVIPPLPPLPPYAKREDCYYGLGWVIDAEFCKSFYANYLKETLAEDITVDCCIFGLTDFVPKVAGYKAIYPWSITLDQPHLDHSMIPPPDPEFESDTIKLKLRYGMCFAFNVDWRTKNMRPSPKQYARMKKMFGGREPVWLRGFRRKREYDRSLYTMSPR